MRKTISGSCRCVPIPGKTPSNDCSKKLEMKTALRKKVVDNAVVKDSKLLGCEGLERNFRDSRGLHPVLRGLTFGLERGELLCISGRSGAGKSTLLHCLAGLLRPDQGRILFEGRQLKSLSEGKRSRLRSGPIGVIFQSLRLLEHLSVAENILLPGLFSGRRKGSDEIARVLEELGLGGYGGAMPGDLSGGERQRVALARSLMQEPTLLLCDEMTANLDQETAEIILKILSRLRSGGRTGILAVSHHPGLIEMADRHLRLEDGLLEQVE